LSIGDANTSDAHKLTTLVFPLAVKPQEIEKTYAIPYSTCLSKCKQTL